MKKEDLIFVGFLIGIGILIFIVIKMIKKRDDIIDATKPTI